MAFQGDLDSFGLANIFQSLTANQQSGTLHVYDEQSERYLVFSQGSIRSVSSGRRKGVPLGEILIARGKLTPEALAGVLAEQAATKKPVGRILVERRLVSQEDIDQALRFQMEDEIYDLFTWRGAKFDFDERHSGDTVAGPDTRISQVSVNSANLLLEAMRRLDDWQRLARIVPSPDIVPVLPAGLLSEEFLAQFDPEDRRIITFLDGINPVAVIIRKSCLGRYAVFSLLARLIEAGAAREARPDEMRSAAATLVVRGEAEAAIPVYRRLVTLAPEDPASRRALVAALDAAGVRGEAATEAGRLADLLASRGDGAGAAEAAAQAAALRPDRPDLLEKHATLATLAGRPEALEAWIHLIRFFDEKKEKPTALEKARAALAALPEAEDLHRQEARLLLETGRPKDAVAIYQKLAEAAERRGDVTSALATLRTIVRIDSSRTDALRRIEVLQTGETQVRHRRRVMGTTRAAALGVGLLLILLAANEVRTVLAVDRALAQAKADAAAADEKDPALRRARISKAIERAEASRPFFALLRGDAFFEASPELQALRALRDRIEQESADIRRRQESVLSDWKRLRQIDTAEGREALEALRALADFQPATDAAREAARLLGEWENQTAEAQSGIRVLLAQIGDAAKPAAERWAAYDNLATTYPGSLRRPSPEGPGGLTLPVRLETIGSTGALLPAKIRIGGKAQPQPTPCTVELPCDPAVAVLFERQGFAGKEGKPAALERGDRLRIQYRHELQRMPLWIQKMRGAIEGAPAISADGRTVFLGTLAGEVSALEAATGKPRWPRPGEKARWPQAAFRLPPLLTDGHLALLDAHGMLVCLAPGTGEALWPKDGATVPTAGMPSTGLRSARIRVAPGGAEGEALAIATRGDLPLCLLDAATGELRWPSNDFGRRTLQEKIGAPVGAPFLLARENTFLLVDADGRLHALLADGTYVGAAELVRGRIETEPLFQPDPAGARLTLAEEGAGLKAFLISGGAPLSPKALWARSDLADEALSAPLLADGDSLWAGLRSGRLLRLGADGKTAGEIALPGPAAGPMARSGDRLLLTCGARDPRPAALFAVRVGTAGPEEFAWRFDIGRTAAPTGVSLHRGAGTGLILFGGDKTLYALEDEAP